MLRFGEEKPAFEQSTPIMPKMQMRKRPEAVVVVGQASITSAIEGEDQVAAAKPRKQVRIFKHISVLAPDPKAHFIQEIVGLGVRRIEHAHEPGSN